MAMEKDFTDKYNTPLSPEEEKQFQAWATKHNKLEDLADYDLRGAFKAGAKPDPERGHLPDTYKKPNHPTFSTESVYHGKDGHEGGQWTETDDHKWEFKASHGNLKHWTPDELKEYFKESEPDARLSLPKTEEDGFKDGLRVGEDH